MFWERLTEDEGLEYIRLRRDLRRYEMWNALKPKEKELVPVIECPPDVELHRLEMLSMQGWGMLTRKEASLISPVYP